jgi:hypothetical protein
MGAARLIGASNFGRCSRRGAGPQYLSNLPQASSCCYLMSSTRSHLTIGTRTCCNSILVVRARAAILTQCTYDFEQGDLTLVLSD